MERDKVFDMKKTFIFITAVISVILCFSSCHNDSGVQSQIDNLVGRIKSLEILCAQMNTNILSLQITTTAIQDKNWLYLTNKEKTWNMLNNPRGILFSECYLK